MKPEKPADVEPSDLPTPDSEAGTPAVKKRGPGGAPVGNQNARKHGVYSTLNDLKRAASERRRRLDRQREREFVAWLTKHGLGSDPFALLMVRQMVEGEAIADALGAHRKRRGTTKRGGEGQQVKEPTRMEVESRARLVDDTRRVIEMLIEQRGGATDPSALEEILNRADELPPPVCSKCAGPLDAAPPEREEASGKAPGFADPSAPSLSDPAKPETEEGEREGSREATEAVTPSPQRPSLVLPPATPRTPTRAERLGWIGLDGTPSQDRDEW